MDLMISCTVLIKNHNQIIFQKNCIQERHRTTLSYNRQKTVRQKCWSKAGYERRDSIEIISCGHIKGPCEENTNRLNYIYFCTCICAYREFVSRRYNFFTLLFLWTVIHYFIHVYINIYIHTYTIYIYIYNWFNQLLLFMLLFICCFAHVWNNNKSSKQIDFLYWINKIAIITYKRTLLSEILNSTLSHDCKWTPFAYNEIFFKAQEYEWIWKKV